MIYCCNLEFSAFWWAKCLHNCKHEEPLHLLLNSHQLIRKSFFNILSLHWQHWFKCVLFRLQYLNLFFMEIHLILNAFNGFLDYKYKFHFTSRLINLPLRDAGLDVPKLYPVWLKSPYLVAPPPIVWPYDLRVLFIDKKQKIIYLNLFGIWYLLILINGRCTNDSLY